MAVLIKAAEAFLAQWGADKSYCIAYSGGLDSHVLLHVFAQLRLQYPLALRAIHVNHSHHPAADAWATHCVRTAESYGIPCQVECIQVVATRQDSWEAIARQQRYHALSNAIQPDEIVLTAHHQEDQAETVMLQLCRGAGPKGLSAMPVMKSLSHGWLGRPWLGVARKILEAYAQAAGLQWIEDDSNQNTAYSRNFIRHVIMPMLKTRWPSVTKTFARVAHHCAEQQWVVAQAVSLAALQASSPGSLSIEALQRQDPVMQRQSLRAWIAAEGFPLPSVAKMQAIQQSLLTAREDKQPVVMWGETICRRYRGALYLERRGVAFDHQALYLWDMTQPLRLPDGSVLTAMRQIGEGLRMPMTGKWTVRFRQGGEMCRLPGRTHRHPLKKLFQTWGVPPWKRDRIPLILDQETVVAVVGYHTDAAWQVASHEAGVVVQWHG